jgi:hypothetical protein
MLRIFQNIRPISAVYIFIVCLLVRLPALLFGNLEPGATAAVHGGLFDTLNQNFYLSISLGLLVVFVQALFFNRLCIEYDVLYVHSYLPAYVYVIVSSIYPENLLLHPSMLLNFGILMSFYFMFRLYQAQSTSKILYYASLFLGIISIVLPVFYNGFIFIVIGTMIFKNISVKDILAIISGYIFPALIAAGVYYLQGIEYTIPQLDYRIKLRLDIQLQAYLATGIIGVYTAAGLFKTLINYNKNNIRTRRINMLIVLYLFFAILIVLTKSDNFRQYFILPAIGIATEVSYFFLGNKKHRIKEVLNYIMLIAVFYSLYGGFLHF